MSETPERLWTMGHGRYAYDEPHEREGVQATEYIRADRATLSSAAVAERQDALFNRVLSDPLVRSVVARPAPTLLAEREPVALPECVLGLIDGKITLAFETPDDAQTAFDIIERTISDPLRLSELEAENARLKARVAELEKAIEPFAAVAEHDIGEDEADDDIFWPISNARYSMSGRLRVAHLRAARCVREGGKVDG